MDGLELETVIGMIWDFLNPVVTSLISEKPFIRLWQPGGPWN